MKRLMCELLLVLMICVAIGTSKNCTEPDPCLTKECLSTADKMMRWLNKSVNPCHNFYSFACEGRRNSHFLPSDKHHLDALNTNDHLAVIRNALAEQSEPTDSPIKKDALQKAKKLYTSCINHRKEDDDLIIKIIYDKFGYWPLTCPSCHFDEDEYDVITMLIEAMFLGAHPLFLLKAGHHGVKDNQGDKRERRRLYIDKPELVWSIDTDSALMQEQKYINIYANRIYAYAQRFGIKNETHAKQAAFEIASQEHLLAQFYLSNDSIVQAEKLTVDTLYKDYGKLLNWKRLVPSIAEKRIMKMPKVGLRDIVYVANPVGLKKVDEYFSTLSPRQIANFIIWRVIHTLDSVLITEDLKPLAIVTESLVDTNNQQMQADRCAAYVSKEFHLLAHKLLYDAYDTLAGPSEIQTVAKELHVVFILLFYSGKTWWKHEITSSAWREKITDLKITLFDFHKWYFELNPIYENISIDENNFIHNVVAINKAAFIRDFRSIKKFNKFEDTQPPHEFQAKYDIYQNKIAYSAIVFKPPLHIGNVPFSVDYAGLGFSIAREMIHAFIYLANGKYDILEFEGWLKQSKPLDIYLQRLDCIFNQYNKDFYGETNKRGEGWKKVFENIADTAGIRLDYLTWSKLESRNEINPLPVPYSEEQVFFIQYAQNFCGLEDTTVAMNKNDKHSLPYIRVTGSLRNSRDFARVFSCPVGSWMNPQDKCELW